MTHTPSTIADYVLDLYNDYPMASWAWIRKEVEFAYGELSTARWRVLVKHVLQQVEA